MLVYQRLSTPEAPAKNLSLTNNEEERIGGLASDQANHAYPSTTLAESMVTASGPQLSLSLLGAQYNQKSAKRLHL